MLIHRWSVNGNLTDSVGGQIATTKNLHCDDLQTTKVPVTYIWLRGFFPHTPDEYDAYESAAKDTAANGVNKVWECYVAGLVPTNAADLFRTVISISDGKPQISWEPRLSAEEEAKRTYTIYGCESLTDGSWGTTNAASRFFRVKVIWGQEAVEP